METYYNPEDLSKFSSVGENAKGLWKKFSIWYESVFKEGALTEKEKALIALAVSAVVQCPYCIDAFTGKCLEKGSNAEQMAEALHVAAAIKGGACLAHGIVMKNAAEKIGI